MIVENAEEKKRCIFLGYSGERERRLGFCLVDDVKFSRVSCQSQALLGQR